MFGDFQVYVTEMVEVRLEQYYLQLKIFFLRYYV